MAPAVDGGDDFVGIGGPDERLGVVVGLIDVAVDGGLEVDDGSKDAALQSALGEGGEEGLDRVQPEQEVGVKWKVKRGWRSSQAITLGCLWVA